MLLSDSFLSLNNLTFSTGFQDVVFNRSDLDLAKKKAVVIYRLLGEPSKISAYNSFLACCEQALLGIDDAPLLDVFINYLSETDAINENEACEKLTRLFCLVFNHQEHALSIAAMALVFVDRPRAFAAFVRYLLHCGVTSEHVLSTHLLQNYFRYYLSSLNQVNNPIEKLYQLLRSSTEGLSLCERVAHVCSDERGFLSYALDGSIHNAPNHLAPVEYIETPLRFTPNAANLKTLHLVFDICFLKGALYQWGNQKNNAVWVNTLKPLFNQPHVVINQLPMIVNSLHEQPLIQKTLAEILNDQSISTLIARHVVGVFNLIPFRPKLVDMLQSNDLSLYFQTARQQNSSGPALFSNLYALFSNVKNTNVAVSLLVFDALLDAIHIDPYVLEDIEMIEKLRKFAHVSGCINQKVRIMEAELDAIIQLQTQRSIKAMDYTVIEDVWRDLAVKIRHFEEIESFLTHFPMDKYALYIQLARVILKSESGVFDLQAFVLALGIEPLFEVLNVTPYERLLIELLTAIDNEKVRALCIQLLDANVSRGWREFNYGGVYLFKKAAFEGNLGLIQWMDASNVKNQYGYDSLAFVAAYAHRWEVVSYFHGQHSLKQGTVNRLYEQASAERSLRRVTTFWSDNHRLPDVVVIENAFKLSVKQNDLDGVECVLRCPQKPKDRVIKQEFYNAIVWKYFDVAILISERFSGKMIHDAINQALKNAARWNQYDALGVLCALINRPSRAAIEIALMSATRNNHLSAVKQLIRFTDRLPRLEVIQKARGEAHKRSFEDIHDYLSTLEDVVKKTTIQTAHNEADSNVFPVRHAVSCSTMSPLHKQGFFQGKSVLLSPKQFDKAKLHRHGSL